MIQLFLTLFFKKNKPPVHIFIEWCGKVIFLHGTKKKRLPRTNSLSSLIKPTKKLLFSCSYFGNGFIFIYIYKIAFR